MGGETVGERKEEGSDQADEIWFSCVTWIEGMVETFH